MHTALPRCKALVGGELAVLWCSMAATSLSDLYCWFALLCGGVSVPVCWMLSVDLVIDSAEAVRLG